MQVPTTKAATDPRSMVHGLIPMAHVADVEASVRFYERLGFDVASRNVVHGRTTWASLSVGQAMLMLTLASGPIDAGQQAVLFYLYCDDVRALRERLISEGVTSAGPFGGVPLDSTPNAGRAVVYDVATPFYMPAGELRIHDPDAYCLLVGQRR